MNPKAAQGILILLSGTAGASGSVLDETGNGPCLISHSSFHIFLFPSVRDVPVFQDMSREQAMWIIRGKTEQGSRRAQGSRNGAGRHSRTRDQEMQEKTGAFGRPRVMEARGLSGGKAEGQNLRTRHKKQVRTEKGRSLYWRVGIDRKGWTGRETREHLRETPALHCTGKLPVEFPC